MDPITLAIVTALAAGVAAGGSKVAEQAIVDGYNALKALIQRKFGGESELAKAVNNLESRPDSEGRKATLKEEVAASQADKDTEILAAAEKLLALVQPQAGVQVTYHAEVRGGGAIAQGSGAKAVGAGGIMNEGDVGRNVNVGRREEEQE